MDTREMRSLAEAYYQCGNPNYLSESAGNEFDAVLFSLLEDGWSRDEALAYVMPNLHEAEVNFRKQSSARKALGRGSSIKDGAKPTGYESKREFRDQEMRNAKDKKNKVKLMPSLGEEVTFDLALQGLKEELDLSQFTKDYLYVVFTEARRQDEEGVKRDDESERRMMNKDKASKGQYISKTQNVVQRMKQQIDKQQRKVKQNPPAGKYLVKQANKRKETAQQEFERKNPNRGYYSG